MSFTMPSYDSCTDQKDQDERSTLSEWLLERELALCYALIGDIHIMDDSQTLV